MLPVLCCVASAIGVPSAPFLMKPSTVASLSWLPTFSSLQATIEIVYHINWLLLVRSSVTLRATERVHDRVDSLYGNYKERGKPQAVHSEHLDPRVQGEDHGERMHT